MGSIIKKFFVEERRSELLPTEWQLEILTYLEVQERFKLSIVCKDWWCAAKHLYRELASSGNPYWKIEVTPTTYNLGVNRALRSARSSMGLSNIQSHPTEKLLVRAIVFGKAFPYEQLNKSRVGFLACDMEISSSRDIFRWPSQKPYSLIFKYPNISNISSLSMFNINQIEFNNIAEYYEKASYITLGFCFEAIDQIWLSGHDHLKALQIQGGVHAQDLSSIAGPLKILSLIYESDAFLTSNFPPNVELLHVDEYLYEDYEFATAYPVQELRNIKTIVLSYDGELLDEYFPVLVRRFTEIINAAPNARNVLLPKTLQCRYRPELPSRRNIKFQFVAMPQSWKLKDLEKFL